MNRESFLKKACGIGVCSCLGFELLANPGNAEAEQNNDWKTPFIKKRFARLIGIMDQTLDEQTKNKIIESLGKECANEGFASNYKNNLEGFLQEIKSRWGEKSHYDKENGIIRIETPERDCVCPLIDSKVISESICQCSVGWQAQTYQTIFNRPVEAKCIESVIKGNKRCVFEMKIL